MGLSADEAFLKIEAILEEVTCSTEKHSLKDMLLEHLETHNEDPYDEVVDAIREHLRQNTDISGEAADEKITFPNSGEFAGNSARDSQHVDSFLYDDDTLETLADEGKFSHNYCDDCGSRNVKLLNLHSHSLPHEANRFVFEKMLSKSETKGKKLLDVGSRTGAMLYTAALYVNNAVVPEGEEGDFSGANSFASIKGIELSGFYCKLQKQTVEQFGMSKHVTVMHDDVFSAAGLAELGSADVLIFNNVFQFFASEEDQKSAWEKVRTTVKKGAILITVPSLSETLELLGMENTWAKQVLFPKPCEPSDEISALHKYIKM